MDQELPLPRHGRCNQAHSTVQDRRAAHLAREFSHKMQHLEEELHGDLVELQTNGLQQIDEVSLQRKS